MKNEIKIRWKDGEGLLQNVEQRYKDKAFEEAQRIANDNPGKAVIVTIVKEKVLKEFRAKPLTHKEKRQKVVSLAICNPTLSMSAIARHYGYSEAFVAKVFRECGSEINKQQKE